MDCAYFFFRGSSNPTLKQLLVSLAFQMAKSNFEIREILFEMIDDGELGGSSEDHTYIWNSVFLAHLLKTSFRKPQFWIIDALDECPSPGLESLLRMISRISPTVPLRVMVTSRTSHDVERGFEIQNIQAIKMSTGGEGSLNDISTYVESQLPSHLASHTGATDDIRTLVDAILIKSDGIFLWVSIVVPMLCTAYTLEAMREVLRHVPSEMTGLYREILDGIKNSPNASVARCVLKWVICAPRLLTTETLARVVRFDLEETLWTSDKFAQICRNLIVVENGLVRMMHQTARDFLVSDASGPYVQEADAHSQLAFLCLRHLSDRRFSPPLPRRATSMTSLMSPPPLDDYATSNFTYHLAHSSTITSPETLMRCVAQFASTNFVTWIERTASAHNLRPFPRAIAHLRKYLAKYRQTMTQLSPEYQLVRSMVGDLYRVISLFGTVLADTPVSIYSLIPPLCPKSSSFYSRFGKLSPQKLICSRREDWDERLSCLEFPDRVEALACNDKYLAVAIWGGSIRVLWADTFELITVLQHGDPVDFLSYGTISHTLASCSHKRIVLWGKKQEELWRVPAIKNSLSMAFNGDDSRILFPQRNGTVISLTVSDGYRSQPVHLPADDSDSDTDDDDGIRKWTKPFLVRHCPVLDLAAIAYRSSILTIAQLEGNEKIGVFEKAGYEGGKLAARILDVAFSPNPDQRFMAITYQDGGIVTIDPWTQREIAQVRVYARFLASSPNGRTLMVGDNDGAILLFDFETMGLLSRIATVDAMLDGIFFSSNLRVLDIRDASCNVWEPPALITGHLENWEASNTKEDYIPASPLGRIPTFDYSTFISSIAHTLDGRFVFCGRNDGTITIHDTTSGDQYHTLTLHATCDPVRMLEWNDEGRLLVSTDSSNRFIGTRLATGSRPYHISDTVFDRMADGRIYQVLFNAGGTRVLISTEKGEEMINTSVADDVVRTHFSSASGRWILHPGNDSYLLHLDGQELRVFTWHDLTKEEASGISIDLPEDIWELTRPALSIVDLAHSNMWQHRKGGLIRAVEVPNSRCTGLIYLDLSGVQPSTPVITGVYAKVDIQTGIKQVLGGRRSKIYFLDKKGWICSMSSKTSAIGPEYYIRHFFIPPFWQSEEYYTIRVLNKISVAFAHKNELVIFEKFLEFEHKIPVRQDVSGD